MTTHSMNHQQAVETMAAERYLLGEMNAEQRLAFEEHYVECAECLEAVMFGSEFLDAGRQVALEQKSERAAQPVPTWRERLLPVFSGWLRPVPAFAFALLLGLVGLNLYQMNVVKRQNNLIAELKAPRQEFRFVMVGDARSQAAEKAITVPRNTQLSVKVEFAPGDDFTPYRADLVSGNVVRYSLPLHVGPNDDSISFSIPAESLGAGSYSLVIRRQNVKGASKDLTRNFVLQFTD
jgi:Putative zinc-finger